MGDSVFILKYVTDVFRNALVRPFKENAKFLLRNILRSLEGCVRGCRGEHTWAHGSESLNSISLHLSLTWLVDCGFLIYDSFGVYIHVEGYVCLI